MATQTLMVERNPMNFSVVAVKMGSLSCEGRVVHLKRTRLGRLILVPGYLVTAWVLSWRDSVDSLLL
jgi:hypothetical protein